FVAKNLDQLGVVLGDLEETLSFRLGGAEGLRHAQKAETVNSVVLDSGIEVSGIVAEVITEGDSPVFFKMKGAVHLAHGGSQLPGQGRDRHPEGFSSPIGPWEKAADPASLTDDGLAKLGLKAG